MDVEWWCFTGTPVPGKKNHARYKKMEGKSIFGLSFSFLLALITPLLGPQKICRKVLFNSSAGCTKHLTDGVILLPHSEKSATLINLHSIPISLCATLIKSVARVICSLSFAPYHIVYAWYESAKSVSGYFKETFVKNLAKTWKWLHRSKFFTTASLLRPLGGSFVWMSNQLSAKKFNPFLLNLLFRVTMSPANTGFLKMFNWGPEPKKTSWTTVFQNRLHKSPPGC